ncbi:hypothetical protein, partial [Bacillus subtilis]|uniref:hypothetical protein n=1 Tax=Bacillus subtilis TaxID=1423 RepID=UPI001BDBA7FA
MKWMSESRRRDDGGWRKLGGDLGESWRGGNGGGVKKGDLAVCWEILDFGEICWGVRGNVKRCR